MRLFAIAITLLSLAAIPTSNAHAAVGCTLDNPQDDLARFFSDFSDFTVHTLSFAVQAPSAHDTLADRLGGELDSLYETPDVPYALYTVRRDGELLGYAFGANQRGTYSNIQVVAITNPRGALTNVYLQKLRSPDFDAFKSEGFSRQLADVPFARYATFADCYLKGRCDSVSVADPSEGRHAEDYRAILRAMAKLHHLSTLLLRPGQPPLNTGERATAQYLDHLWIPEQGFGPLDTPHKVSAARATPYILDPDALVAALPGRDRVTLYPISLLTAHPVLQDLWDGRTVTIAWSSASHTLSVVESVGEPDLRFSHTMSLLFGHQTMLERTTRAEWSPILARAVQGPASDGRLRAVPGAIVLPWRLAERLYPAAEVATPSDPHSRHKAFYAAHRDRFDRPLERTRALVIPLAGGPALVRPQTLLAMPFYQTKIGQTSLLIVSDSGGRAVYDRSVAGALLNFDLHQRDVETGVGLLIDRETGSIWEALTGRAIRGPLQGANLTPKVFHELPEASAVALFPRRR
jgi:hypothetical protein